MPLGMLGKYERLDVLGHGASGIVYLARDTLLNRQVALKEIDAAAGDVRRFLEEARLLDRLRHPNIVRVHNIDRIEGHLVIDMEYVKGKNLAQILREEGSLPLGQALEIIIQVLNALDYAHSLQTVHRDIKPANILVGRDGIVKLVDFGLAEILATNAYACGAGTYAYMAPEDFSSDERSDYRSDLWAVGITLYEMLAGERPFQVRQARDPFAWKRTLENNPPTPITFYLPDAPPELQATLNKALAHAKQNRYPSAAAFRDDLLHLRGLLAPHSACLRSSQPPQTYVSSPKEETLGEEVFSSKGAHLTASPPSPMLKEMPGTVVAEVPPEIAPNPLPSSLQPVPSPSRSLFGLPARPPIMVANPPELDFGELHKGEKRQVRLRVLSKRIRGDANARVLYSPKWLDASPLSFSNTRQTLTLIADSQRVWETGEFEDHLCIEGAAGSLKIPLYLKVLPPRPTFWQVAWWFLPLWLLGALPLLLSTFSFYLNPSALPTLLASGCVSGLMGLSLFLICLAAGVGKKERASCLVLIFIMCFLAGGTAALLNQPNLSPHLQLNILIGAQQSAIPAFILSSVLLLQLLYRSKWKFWAAVLGCAGLLLNGMLLRLLNL